MAPLDLRSQFTADSYEWIKLHNLLVRQNLTGSNLQFKLTDWDVKRPPVGPDSPPKVFSVTETYFTQSRH